MIGLLLLFEAPQKMRQDSLNDDSCERNESQIKNFEISDATNIQNENTLVTTINNNTNSLGVE